MKNPRNKEFYFRTKTYQDLFKEDLTTFSFLTYHKNLLLKWVSWQLFLLTNHLCCFLQTYAKMKLGVKRNEISKND